MAKQVVTFTPAQTHWLKVAGEEANGNVVVWVSDSWTNDSEIGDIEIVWTNKDGELHGRVVSPDGRFGVTNAPA